MPSRRPDVRLRGNVQMQSWECVLQEFGNGPNLPPLPEIVTNFKEWKIKIWKKAVAENRDSVDQVPINV
jgi:hypothetical protein